MYFVGTRMGERHPSSTSTPRPKHLYLIFCYSATVGCLTSFSVAEKLAKDLRGRIKIEDAGFDWKVRRGAGELGMDESIRGDVSILLESR